MKGRWIVILPFVLCCSFIITPIFSVWADQLPYQQPTYKEYRPNPKPIIPQGIKVKQSKPKTKAKAKDKDSIPDNNWADAISNTSTYTPIIWNIFGDVGPNYLISKYALLNNYVVLRTSSKKVKVVLKDPIRIADWMVPWRKRLYNAGWKIGPNKVPLGRYIYQSIEKLNNKLVIAGQSDLRKQNYTHPQFQSTKFANNQAVFVPGRVNVWGKTVSEFTKSLKESFLLTSKTSTSSALPKLTGVVGLGFSGIITTLNYTIGEDRDKGWADYIAAVPLDFMEGAIIGATGAGIAVVLAAVAFFVFETTLTAATVAAIGLFVSFILGFLIEAIPVAKQALDAVHDWLTRAIRKSSKLLATNYQRLINICIMPIKLGMKIANKSITVQKQVKNVLFAPIKLGMSIANKSLSVAKQVTSWIANKIR